MKSYIRIAPDVEYFTDYDRFREAQICCAVAEDGTSLFSRIENRTDVKGIRTKKYGIGVEVLGIYVFNDVIYIHSCISNDTNISFEVDARRFIVADRKLAKRTAQQQTPLEVLRVCNDPAVVRGHQRQRTVFALPKLTISDDKVLLLEIIEKNGARHQTVEIPAEELLEAKLL